MALPVEKDAPFAVEPGAWTWTRKFPGFKTPFRPFRVQMVDGREGRRGEKYVDTRHEHDDRNGASNGRLLPSGCRLPVVSLHRSPRTRAGSVRPSFVRRPRGVRVRAYACGLIAFGRLPVSPSPLAIVP